ncbi:MAG TPA: NAD(P)-dependent alcohol dehydrogenase [Herpetosiphonaceae bacterium]|nr:NAD(P)-dependent alcohol dehydrogenase [Herpetosiphonaceae bacterium]
MTITMNAVVHTEYGAPEVLKMTRVDKPVPRRDEVLIRVYATTVTSAECAMRKGEPRWGRVILGFRRPREKFSILGLELAGRIEAVGSAVSRFKVGDEVFGFTGFGARACAEYVCMPERGSLAPKPAGLTYEQAAAAVDGASTALFFLRDKGKLQPGQRVLINGASGSIGTYAVQLAKYFGAEVTGVCSGANHGLVASLGADRMIDYTREDFTRLDQTYDIIFDAVGKSSFARCKRALAPQGRYLATVISPMIVLQSAWTALLGGKRMVSGMSVEKNAALVFLKRLIEEGRLTPVIDRCYPLDQIVEAHRYVERGHKRGNVVITLGGAP